MPVVGPEKLASLQRHADDVRNVIDSNNPFPISKAIVMLTNKY